MIAIRSKSEIIDPFETIGEKQWSDKTEYIITEFADFWEEELAHPISVEMISELEERLGTTLPDNLKLFYQKFGISNIGEQLQNLDEIDWIKNSWNDTPEYGPDFSAEDQKYLPFLISFSDCLGNGNRFCFHSETKEIYFFDHDTRPYLIKLFDDVGDYIRACLISCQADLFHQEIGQEQVEQWCHEILNELFGAMVVKKWKF